MGSAETAELSGSLLSLERAAGMDASGGVDAAVLVPVYGWPAKPGLVFTERRHDLRRHAGEISFPGGRRDPADGSYVETALRESDEEIGLNAGEVEIVGALPPIGTFVTNYKVHPIVGLIGDLRRFEPSPDEVETVLAFGIDALRDAFAMRRLVRRGLPIRTPTYLIGEHLIWGATARIVADLLARLR